MNKTILVSGAGSGIGRAIAANLADAGYAVILSGRNRQALQATLALLDTPARHTVMPADLRDLEALRTGLKTINPTLHGVIANAGIGGKNQYGPADRWHDIIDTNLTGTYQLVQEALLYFAPASEGYRQIVLISSLLARLGAPGHTAYCASKAGQLGLMRSWAAQLASENILVNAVCPGWVNTQMAVDGIETFAQATGKSYETTLEEQMQRVPLGKMSEPQEVADLVNYLVSQSSITGQALDINNGTLMPA
jgi:3-oxoacyl-[acyl-carrier protein] reductase